MLQRYFKNGYGGSGSAVEVDPGYRDKLQRKRRPRSTRRREASASSIIFCSDGMTLRSVIPESVFRSAQSRSAANLGGVILARGNHGLEWRIMPEPVIGPCIVRTRWAPIRFTDLRQRAERSNDSEAATIKSSRTAALHAARTRQEYRRNHITGLKRMRTKRFPDHAESGCRRIGASAHAMIADLGRLARAGLAAWSRGIRLLAALMRATLNTVHLGT